MARPGPQPATSATYTPSRSRAPIQAPPRSTSPARRTGEARSTIPKTWVVTRPPPATATMPARTVISWSARVVGVVAEPRDAEGDPDERDRRDGPQALGPAGGEPDHGGDRRQQGEDELDVVAGGHRSPSRAVRVRNSHELARPPPLGDAGCGGPLADRRLGDPEPRGGLLVGQALVDEVGDLPAPVRTPCQQGRPQPDRRLQGPRRVARPGRPDPPRARLGRGDGLARRDVRRPAPGAGLVGERGLDLADPDPDVPGVGTEQVLERERAARPGRRARPGTRRRRCAGRRAGPGRRRARSSAVGTWSGCVWLPCWSTVSTTTRIPAPSLMTTRV